MSRDETQSIPTLTEADFEAVLNGEHDEAGEPRLKAKFNPIEAAKKAVALAKIAAPFLAIAATTNWASPISAAKAIVALYDLIQGVNPSNTPA